MRTCMVAVRTFSRCLDLRPLFDLLSVLRQGLHPMSHMHMFTYMS